MQGQRETNASNTSLIDDIYDDIMLNEEKRKKTYNIKDYSIKVVEKKEELLDADIEALIQERQAARKAKNFARADEIRDLLTEKGIILEDTREGVRWKRA